MIKMTSRNTTINIRDNPRVFRNFLSTLPNEGTTQDAINDGNVIAETSIGTTMGSTAALLPQFTAFTLRSERTVRLPDHVFGKLELGDAFSGLIAIPFLLPAVGTSVILQPKVTAQQAKMLEMYQFCQADAFWFVCVPCPLGTAYILRATAPEFDPKTKTRGVRWKPAAFNTMPLYLPWNSDVSVVPTGLGRPGQSGLAVKIETVENNTSTTVQENLTAIAFCLVTNVRLNSLNTNSGLGDMKGIEVPGLRFRSVALSEQYQDEEEIRRVKYETHSDNGGSSTTEVQAEGANNQVSDAIPDLTPSRSFIPTTERPLKQPKPPRPGTGKGKRDQTGMLNAVWFELGNLTLKEDDIGKTIEYTIDPLKLDELGESISLPFTRNVWCSGNNKAGYVRTLVVKAAIARPPTISGYVEFRDSTNVSSRYLVEYGGVIEFPVIPLYYANPRNGVPRDSNNCWMRTNQMKCVFTYTILAVNRSVDQSDVTMTLFVKIGDTVFQSPTKPEKPVKYNLDIYRFLSRTCEAHEEESEKQLLETVKYNLHSDVEINTPASGIFSTIVNQSADVSNNLAIIHDSVSQTPEIQQSITKVFANTIAPEASEETEQGESNLGGAYEEEIDQDHFQVECFNEQVKVGETIAIPLNLSVITDLAGDGDNNVITQKFQRNAQIIPRGDGQFGPSCGTYTISLRLPTTIAADIEHVQLPGDMIDEAVIRVFGLSSILSMATSALQGIGGPLISGVIQAGREVLGSLGQGLGGKPSNESSQSSNPSANPVSLMGGIDVSRFINFLKPILENEQANPTFGALIMKIRDVLTNDTRAITTLPVRVFVRMDKSAIERTVFDRTVTPATQGIQNRIYIPTDAYSRILKSFMSTENTFISGSKQNIHFVQFLKCAFSPDFRTLRTGITLDQVLSTEIQPDEYQTIMTLIKHTVSGEQS
jgi:hypothetical protein